MMKFIIIFLGIIGVFLDSKAMERPLEYAHQKEKLSKIIDVILQKENAKTIPSLLKGLNGVSFKEPYEKLFANVETKSLSLFLKSVLIEHITPVALQHALEDKLKEAHEKILGNSWIGPKEERRDEARVKTLRSYASFDNTAALETDSFKLLQERFPTRNLKDKDFELLLLMLRMDEQGCHLFIERLKKEELGWLIEGLLNYPNYLAQFEGTPVDINHLIDFGLNRLLAQDVLENKDKFLEVLATRCECYHYDEEFIEKIISIFKNILHEHIQCFTALAAFTDSRSPKISLEALRALGQYCSTHDDYWAGEILNIIFKVDVKNIAHINRTTADVIYKNLYNLFKENGREELIQKLFISLLAQEATQLEARILILQHMKIFDVVLMDRLLSHEDIYTFINLALQEAQKAQTLTRHELTHMFIAAEETGFKKYFNNNFSNKLSYEQIFDSTLALSQRAKLYESHLREILESNNAEEEKKEAFISFVESLQRLEEGVFKQWAFAFLQAIRIDTPSYERFFALRTLNTLMQKEQGLSSKGLQSMIINNLYNALKNQRTTFPSFLKNIDQCFEKPFLSGSGLMFGFRQEGHRQASYSFYACDEQTGFAIWRAPFQMSEKVPYRLWKKKLYIPINENIIVLDSETGQEERKVSLPYKDKIHLLEISLGGTLYAVQYDDNRQENYNLTSMDLESYTINYSQEISPAYYKSYLNGDSLVLFAPESDHTFLNIYSPLSPKSKNLNLSEDKIRGSYPVIKNNILIYQTEDKAKNIYNLICFDLADCKQLWSITLLEPIKRNPIISSDNEQIYIITNKSVMAIQMNLGFFGFLTSSRTIWNVPIKKKECYEMKLSSDNNLLYVLEWQTGSLLSFDCKSGTKTEVGTFSVGRHTHLVAIPKDQVYIQGINF